MASSMVYTFLLITALSVDCHKLYRRGGKYSKSSELPAPLEGEDGTIFSEPPPPVGWEQNLISSEPPSPVGWEENLISSEPPPPVLYESYKEQNLESMHSNLVSADEVYEENDMLLTKDQWAAEEGGMSVEEFISKFNKTYVSEEEKKKRILIFQENLKEMQEHNKMYEDGKSSYMMGINEFSDWTDEEFFQKMTGLDSSEISEMDNEDAIGRGSYYYVPKESGPKPEYLDYRMLGAVNPVKRQGPCGSCSVFAAVASIESQIFLKRGVLLRLSEQNMVDCQMKICHPDIGTWPRYVMDYVVKNSIAYEKDYPYTNVVTNYTTCKFNVTKNPYRLTGRMRIKRGSDEDLIDALIHMGPISIAMPAPHFLRGFLKGVFEDERCINNPRSEHAMTLVGYGEQDGKKYWLIRNSWGEGWGDNGYFKLSREAKNYCIISNHAATPIVEDPCEPFGGVSVTGQCLIFFEDFKTWEEAASSCADKGQRIAVLKNPLVVNYHLQSNHVGKRFWLGGLDEIKERTWVNGQSMFGFPWGPGQSDNWKSNDNCLEWGKNNTYSDGNCTGRLSYICEHGIRCSGVLEFGDPWDDVNMRVISGWMTITFPTTMSSWKVDLTFNRDIIDFIMWSMDVDVTSTRTVTLTPKHWIPQQVAGDTFRKDFQIKYVTSDTPKPISTKLNGKELC